MPQQDFAALAARLQALEDRVAILDTLRRVTCIEDEWPGRSRPATGLVAAGSGAAQG